MGPVDEKLKVLLAEDNPGDEELVKEGIEEADSEVSLTVLRDGDAVLDYLNQRGDYENASIPDLLFLDLNLPRVRGEEVLQELKSDLELQTTPVFIISGSEAEHDIATAYRKGASAYFEKPVDPDEYISLIKSITEAFAKHGMLPSSE